MKKVITTMLVAAMVLSMAMPTSAATITRKKGTGTTASTTKVSGDYSLKMVDKTLQFIRGGKVVSSIETKDGKITLRKSSAGGISVVFTDANGKRRNITLGKQDSVALSGTFVQVSVDKALGSSFEVEMEKGSKVTNFYAKGAAKVTLNGSVTTLNVTSSNANVAANGTVSRAYAVNKKSISGMPAGKITQTSTGTSSNGSVNTATKSSNSSNTTVNSGSGSSGSSSSGGSSGIIINGGGSNNGGNSTSKRNPTVSYTASVIPTYDEGTVLTNSMLTQFGLKATYGNSTVAGTFSWTKANTKVAKGTSNYSVTFTPKDTKTYNTVQTSVKIIGKEVAKTQTLAEAKAAIEAKLNGASATNATVQADIQKVADDAIVTGSGITAAVSDFKVNPATTTAAGSVTATITLTKGTETATIKVNLPIAQLSALQAAKAEVEAALAGIKESKDITKADVEAVVTPIDKKYSSVEITVGEVKLDETAKTVVVEVTLKEGENTEKVSKTWNYTDPVENTDLADAVKAIEALKGPYSVEDAAVKAVEDINAAVAKINKDIKVDTSKVALSEDKSTIAGEVGLALTVNDKEEKATANFSATVTTATKAAAPTFEIDLQEATQNIVINKENPAVLTVKAVSSDGGDISYQWYKNSVKDAVADEKLAIPNATGETYAPTTTGTAFYYVIATNTLGESKATTPSKCARVIVSYPEGSAQEPVIANTSKLSDASYNMVGETISPLVVDASVDKGELSYQWYKTDSAVAENGTAIDKATSASYTPPKELGTNYYYCVVTNKDTSVTEGMQEVSVKTRAVEIKVTATVGATIAPVNNAEGTTTQITFTFAREIPNLETTTKEDFTLKGKGTHTDDKACTLKIDRVVSRADNKQITLDISGVDMNEPAEVAFTKTFDGFKITPSSATINITKTAVTPPTEDLEVTAFTANGTEKEADTTEVTVTFNQEVVGLKGSDLTIDGVATIGTPTTTDKKTYKVPVTLDAPKGSETKATIKLTVAGTAVLPTEKPSTTAYYDTTAPIITDVLLNTENPKELFVFFNDEVKVTGSTATNLFDYSGTATISTVVVSTDKEKCVVVTLVDNGTLNTTLTYKGGASDKIKDVSVKGNEVATKDAMIVTASDPDAANASTVTINKVETKTDNGKITEAYAKVNTPIKMEVVKGQTSTDPDKDLAKAFTIVADDGKSYTPEKVTIVTTAPRTTTGVVGSYFKFEFKAGAGPAAGAVITDVQFSPEKVKTVEVVSYFKPETKVEEIVVEAEASKPLESDLKILSVAPAGIEKDMDSRGHKNNGKYSVSMSGNEITVTVNDQLVAYDDVHANKVAANGAQAFTPILVQVNKTYGTAKSENAKAGDEATDTEYLEITNKATGKGGQWNSDDIKDVANYNQAAADRKDTFVLWVEGDKAGTTAYTIKTAEGETPIEITVKVVPFAGDTAVGLAQLKATTEAVKDKSDKVTGCKLTVDPSSLPVNTDTVWYIASTKGNSSVEYGDTLSNIAPTENNGARKQITEKDGAYVVESISEFGEVEDKLRSTTIGASDWNNDVYGGYIHVYAADKDGKIIGYVIVNVPKAQTPVKEDTPAEGGSGGQQVASINLDDNDNMTIGASDEKKD